MALNDYILVKDKDGQMKYFKDGRFFGVEEIEALNKKKEDEGSKAKVREDLKPIYSFETKKRGSADFEIEALQPSEVHAQRSSDQKIIDDKAQAIIGKLKIQFSDVKIKDRFINVLATFFRGIRKLSEIEYVLTLPKASGGLELPPEKAGIILTLLEHYAEEIEKERRNMLSSANKVPQTKVGESKIIDEEHRLPSPPPAVIERKKDPIADFASKMELKQTMPKPQIEKPAASPAQIAKPKIEDVKGGSKLMGPIEELAYMDLKDFHRLGKNEKEQADQLLEQIELLGQQSLLIKLQGIKALKKSPLFQLYLSINLEGIRIGKTVEEIIESRQFRNESTLTLSEFEAINALSGKLSL